MVKDVVKARAVFDTFLGTTPYIIGLRGAM